jgi:transcriptional regulator with XRE-family HTH domain
MISELGEKLHDQGYRKAFVASQINFGVPFQLRALLKARGKTQEWLAEEAGMLQPRISGLLTPGKTRPNIETLRRLAEAFDCGLAVRFVPFSELTAWSEGFDPESFYVPSFDDDPGFVERTEPARSGIVYTTNESHNNVVSIGDYKLEQLTTERISPQSEVNLLGTLKLETLTMEGSKSYAR